TVAEPAGEDERLAARHRRRLDEQDVAAGPGHGEAGGDTGHGRPLRGLPVEALAAERVADSRLVDDDGRRDLLGGDLRRRLAQELAELALELAHACLARVVSDDEL